jgi:hypothetical protein
MGGVCFPVCGDTRDLKDANDTYERAYIVGSDTTRHVETKYKGVPLPAFHKPKVICSCVCMYVCVYVCIGRAAPGFS